MIITERLNEFEVITSYNGREFVSSVILTDKFSVGFAISETGIISHNLKSKTLFEVYCSIISNTVFAKSCISVHDYASKIVVDTWRFHSLVNQTFEITENIGIEE